MEMEIKIEIGIEIRDKDCDNGGPQIDSLISLRGALVGAFGK